MILSLRSLFTISIPQSQRANWEIICNIILRCTSLKRSGDCVRKCESSPRVFFSVFLFTLFLAHLTQFYLLLVLFSSVSWAQMSWSSPTKSTTPVLLLITDQWHATETLHLSSICRYMAALFVCHELSAGIQVQLCDALYRVHRICRTRAQPCPSPLHWPWWLRWSCLQWFGPNQSQTEVVWQKTTVS